MNTDKTRSLTRIWLIATNAEGDVSIRDNSWDLRQSLFIRVHLCLSVVKNK